MEEEQSAWPSLSTAMAHQTLDEGNAFSPHRETTGGGVGLHPHSKASAFRREKQVNPLVRKISWRRKPHPSILAWRIPWTEEAGGLQSMGSHAIHMISYLLIINYLMTNNEIHVQMTIITQALK